MTRLNRKVEYALMALKIMAFKRPGELTSAKEVSDTTGCPFDATARVLQLLAQAEILRSEQGAHGGYHLTRDLSRLSLLELMELLLGKISAAKCLHGDCELEAGCNILTPVSILNRKYQEFYQSISVAELLRVRDSAVHQEVRA
jgi:Rrf2 family protein